MISESHRLTASRVNPSHRYMRALFVAIVVLAIALIFWRVFLTKSDVDQAISIVNSAYAEGRPVAARVSGLQYAPYSERAVNADGQQKLHAAEMSLVNIDRSKPTAETHHALARIYLLERRWDYCLLHFDEALKLDTRNPELFSDLAAAYIEQATDFF